MMGIRRSSLSKRSQRFRYLITDNRIGIFNFMKLKTKEGLFPRKLNRGKTVDLRLSKPNFHSIHSFIMRTSMFK